MIEKLLLNRKIFNSVRHIALLLYLEDHSNDIEINDNNIKKLKTILGTDCDIVLTDLIKLDYIYLNIDYTKNKMVFQLTTHGKVFIKRIIKVCEDDKYE